MWRVKQKKTFKTFKNKIIFEIKIIKSGLHCEFALAIVQAPVRFQVELSPGNHPFEPEIANEKKVASFELGPVICLTIEFQPSL